ncbi:extracellular solute-binding protein family 5 [Paenibacillus algicola]|uniref:Extracellular solute-binding protein family 5 n=1 Tax=Paenibacillus algicola TaxID=2565926 RepID=A0A4P8XVH1_9BACL|nr:ABC transporter substrate-binding protein [Paenibacillus algicola]QCT04889.1 extracellular solute-binding protein family 5 [Paenibacillus algicola]
MKKRMSLLLVMLLMAVSVLAACSGGNSAEESGDTGTQQEAPANNEGENTEEPSEGEEESYGYFEAEDPSANPTTATDRTDTLIIGMTSPKGVFNPYFWQTAYDKYVVNTIFDTFLEVSGDGTYTESLAESVDVSEDGLKYTFKLKPGVTYTDGTPMTVNDYVFAMKIMLDPAYDGESDMMSMKIVGSKEYKEGDATEISGIKVIDDLTVEVTVEEATALTRDYLGDVALIPQHYYGKDFKKGDMDSLKTLHDKPLGSGPYIMTKFSPGQEVVFEANENYFKGAPKIKNLVYKTTTDETMLPMLQSGEIDMDMITVSEDNVEEVKTMGFLDLNIFPTNGYGYVAFNHNVEKFQDQKVRQALMYGLNRAEIVESIYGIYANPLNIPESSVSWAFTDENVETYDFDPEKAKELLAEAGWAAGADGVLEKDGQKFTIDFSATADNPVVEALLPIMTANYQDLGIEIKAETLDFNAIMDKKDQGNFEMFFAAWGLTPDPDNTVYITDGAQNDTGYSNATVDELMQKGKMELGGPEARAEIYKQMYQEMNKDLPNLFLYQRRDGWAINSRVNGLDITAYKDFPYSLYQATLE